MENIKLNEPLQNLIVSYQVKLIDQIDAWNIFYEKPTQYQKGIIEGLKSAKEIFIETIKEMENKYNETL